MSCADLMHGTHWSGQDLAAWWVSEKLDGCRAWWDGRALWTKSGQRAHLPTGWAQALPPVPLDAELYAGPGSVYACGAALKHGHYTPAMRLHVFDSPGSTSNHSPSREASAEDWPQRLHRAALALARAGTPQHIACIVPHSQATSTAQALALMAQVQQRGGEGLMLRRPGALYRPGRTDQLLKLKRHPDA